MESRVGGKSSRCKVHYSLGKDDTLFGERGARLGLQYGMDSRSVAKVRGAKYIIPQVRMTLCSGNGVPDWVRSTVRGTRCQTGSAVRYGIQGRWQKFEVQTALIPQ